MQESCAVCGRHFRTSFYRKDTCSPYCLKAQRAIESGAAEPWNAWHKHAPKCAHCDVVLPPNRKKYCNKNCQKVHEAQTSPQRVCIWCHKTYTATNKYTCSGYCYHAVMQAHIAITRKST